MKQEEIEWVRECIENNNLILFYTWSKWLKVRKEILTKDKNECQKCKSQGKYTRATMVHHVNYVRKHPELSLEKTYTDTFGEEKRQLVSLCKNCHEEEHPERLRQYINRKPLTEEKW